MRMKTIEFITNEIKTAAISEISMTYDQSEHPLLIDSLNHFFQNNISDLSDFEELEELANSNSRLGSLKSINYIIQLIQLSSINPEANEKAIEQKMINEPRNKLYPLLWVLHKVEMFHTDEYLDSEYAAFLETTATSYGYLFELDDFITSTTILLYQQLADTQEYEMFQKVFLKASALYSQKHPLKKMLARLYFKNNDYFPALECIEQLIHDKHTPGCECDFEEQLDAIQFAGIINYKLGNTERAMIQINYVIDNIPKWEDNNKKVSNTLSFIDAYLYRMRYNISKGNSFQVMDDFNQVEMDLFYCDWEHTHPDVFDYIKKIA
jgi:tetratricopeptide (TPR) repeat protein